MSPDPDPIRPEETDLERLEWMTEKPGVDRAVLAWGLSAMVLVALIAYALTR